MRVAMEGALRDRHRRACVRAGRRSGAPARTTGRIVGHTSTAGRTWEADVVSLSTSIGELRQHGASVSQHVPVITVMTR